VVLLQEYSLVVGPEVAGAGSVLEVTFEAPKGTEKGGLPPPVTGGVNFMVW